MCSGDCHAPNPHAKLFKNGASQAVRLPAEFRYDGNEVYATRDEQTGESRCRPVPAPGPGRVFFL